MIPAFKRKDLQLFMKSSNDSNLYNDEENSLTRLAAKKANAIAEEAGLKDPFSVDDTPEEGGRKPRRVSHDNFPPKEKIVGPIRERYEDYINKKAAARTAAVEKEAEGLSPVNPELGLTDEQVAERKERGLVNVTEKKGIRSTGQIIFSHTVTYFNFLNIFLGVLVFLTGQYKNMLFLGVIICNSVIGIVQELRVRKLIRSLSVVTASRADVRRNGSITDIPVEEIVLDDIVEITIGDQITTDGVLLAGNGIEINESMLTGEAKPVHKKAGDPLLSGTFVTAGSGAMQVQKVGRECYAAQLVEKTRTRHRASSEMQVTIGRIIKVVSIAIIPLGLLLYRSQHAAATAQAIASGYDSDWVYAQSVVRTVSGVIGMIPEGLVLLTSVSFIIGVGRLALKKALVQEMEAIEALARVNVLCTDKTGTITTGQLEVTRLISVAGTDPSLIRSALAHLGGAFDDVNDTQDAMNRYFGVAKDWTVTASIPFSSTRKYKAASFGENGTYVIGAPEILMPERKDIASYVSRYTSKGFRVLLLCSSEGLDPENENKGKLTPCAIVVLSDVIKEDAKEIFSYFERSGVHVKVLSGDNPETVSAVAAKAGVAGAEKYVDASTLPENPIALAQEITKYNVFGRVKPEQKQAFVKAWQLNNNTVAMVGDGVNDVLAIKDADCGIAMAKGSEAARQAAHIVLMDSDFSSMRDIVQEGKTIICNIERVSSLYLTKTIYASILCLIFILLKTSYPWTTLQMGLINICGIGMPSFLLALERHENWKSEGFLIHVIRVCVPAALTMVSAVILFQIMNALFGWNELQYSFFAVMIGGFVALMVVAEVCWPLNPYRTFVLGACIAVLLAAVIFLPGFYDISPLWSPWSLLLIPVALLLMVLIYWYSRWTKRLMARFLTRWEEDHASKMRFS